MNHDDGGSAFPKAVEYADSPPVDGMTLRDYFAGQALAIAIWRGGWSSKPDGTFPFADEAARLAYMFADAMIAERKKP